MPIGSLSTNWTRISAEMLEQYNEALLRASREQERAYALDKEKSRVQNLADLDEFIEKGTCKMSIYVDQTKKFLLRSNDTYYCSIQEGLLKVRKSLSDDHKQLFARLADREGFNMTLVENFRTIKPVRILYYDWKRQVDDSDLFSITDDEPKRGMTGQVQYDGTGWRLQPRPVEWTMTASSNAFGLTSEVPF